MTKQEVMLTNIDSWWPGVTNELAQRDNILFTVYREYPCKVYTYGLIVPDDAQYLAQLEITAATTKEEFSNFIIASIDL